MNANNMIAITLILRQGELYSASITKLNLHILAQSATQNTVKFNSVEWSYDERLCAFLITPLQLQQEGLNKTLPMFQ